MKESQTSITIRLPKSKRSALDKLADKRGASASSIMRGLFYAELEREAGKQ